MNRLAVISSFLGGMKNRYLQYTPERTLAEKFAVDGKVRGLDGLELCYPADFEDPGLLERLLADSGLAVSAVNVRSRRTGRWLRGAFSSPRAEERAEVVDDFRRAIDLAAGLGVMRVSTCPLNDGHDTVFEMDYRAAYQCAEETFQAISAHDRRMRVCIEYKQSDPRTRCLFASAGETLSFCQSAGADNLGVTLDFGHALQAGERPAQSAVLLHRAGRLFYVHLNDNDRTWDWDMVPGSFHFWEFIEFLYYLKELGCTDDWYAYDVMTKELDTAESFQLVVDVTRRLEALAGRLERERIAALLAERNPVHSLRYLYETLT